MRARPYLHCAPVPGGVYFSGARTQFVLKGWDHLFKLADICVPLLERGTTEDDLVAALGTERARPVVRHLTGGLRDHGMLLDEDVLRGDRTSTADRDRYAGTLAYVESVCADPYTAFAAIRAAHVVLIGPATAVRPAARGLDRAGVGQVLAPDGTGLAACEGADVVMWCGSGESAPGWVSEGVPIVPVLLDDHVLQVGPVIRHAAQAPLLGAFHRRVLDWAQGEELGPAARPVADAMAGAIAGQLVLDVLAGLDEGGAAHVVHGTELVAERVLLHSADPVDGLRTLDAVHADPLPDPDEAIEWVNTLTARWKGLFAATPAEQTLPQMPLAVRDMALRTGSVGRTTVWAFDQRSATVGAALEVLRNMPTVTQGATGAAGATEERWLLDGVLRLLAGEAESVHTDIEESEETARIRRILKEWQPAPLTTSLLHVPGLDWRLARVEITDSGEPLGASWAPDADTATREALSTALARAQVEAARGSGADVPQLVTDSVSAADEEQIGSLREQALRLGAERGVSYEGRRARTDPVLGEIPFWSGPVRARQLTQEPRHAG
ncbi:hypothetical protein OG785_04885 [Streptomyces sp. NBC_00006]|uniref:hypothetical protein n=1 Tax=unclassified Streptomyces TaxID=2593676 RepID=UPI002256C512|nr:MULTISPECIES: hypothetical protein [unclassified Streptomyces]MCX4834195.1 hypothetical protein [Streptomyces sp. NBC_01016]MCX5529894.1 hypothetical protein [Streptomyces sp. NBC_00006]